MVDGEARPLTGVDVSAVASQWINSEQLTDHASTATGPDGMFQLTSLHHELPHTLVFQARGFGRTLFDVDAGLAVEGTVDLEDIELLPPRDIEGGVLTADGEPVPNATVRLRRQ